MKDNTVTINPPIIVTAHNGTDFKKLTLSIVSIIDVGNVVFVELVILAIVITLETIPCEILNIANIKSIP